MEPKPFTASKREPAFKPFLGVIDKRGVAFEVGSIATGLGSYTLNGLLEAMHKEKPNREEAIDVLTKTHELSFKRDCRASEEFDICCVEEEGVRIKQQKNEGDWELVDKFLFQF